MVIMGITTSQLASALRRLMPSHTMISAWPEGNRSFSNEREAGKQSPQNRMRTASSRKIIRYGKQGFLPRSLEQISLAAPNRQGTRHRRGWRKAQQPLRYHQASARAANRDFAPRFAWHSAEETPGRPRW